MSFFTRYILNLEIFLNMAKKIRLILFDLIYQSFCIVGCQNLHFSMKNRWIKIQVHPRFETVRMLSLMASGLKGHLTDVFGTLQLAFKDVCWLQLLIQTFFLTSLFRFKNI